MRYKQHTIEAFYLPGSDFKMVNGCVVARKPTSKDIDYVRITPDDGRPPYNCSSFKEAKADIDQKLALEKTL